MLKKRVALVLIILLFLMIVYLITGLDNSLVVTHYTITDSSLPEGFDGFVIVQLSDLHGARFGDDQKDIIRLVQNENPDIVLLTGDMIDSKELYSEPAIELVSGLSEFFNVYAVTGNHEIDILRRNTNFYNESYAQLIAAGMIDLDNSSVIFGKNGDFIRICGFADPRDVKTNQELIKRFNNNISSLYYPETYNILLLHRANLAEWVRNKEFNVIFSGDNHGGQIRLPLVGGVISEDRSLFPKYDSGVYKLDDSFLIVNRGLGNTKMLPRIHNPPEVVVVTLKR